MGMILKGINQLFTTAAIGATLAKDLKQPDVKEPEKTAQPTKKPTPTKVMNTLKNTKGKPKIEQHDAVSKFFEELKTDHTPLEESIAEVLKGDKKWQR